MTATIIRSPWESQFRELVRSAGERLIISAPFITRHGWHVLENELAAADIGLRVSTSFRARAASTGALDVNVLADAHQRLSDIEIRNVLGLHAKVYVADDEAAIITSGNLTRASLRDNVERGLLVTDPALVREIADDVLEYAGLSPLISTHDLREAARHADDARREHGAALPGREPLTPAERKFDDLMKHQHGASGKSQNSILADTILYLLRDGPLATADLHPKIKAAHPDICNDDEERIINGIRFGKKWKHAVRNAQQYLKRQGRIEQTPDGCWHLTD